MMKFREKGRNLTVFEDGQILIFAERVKYEKWDEQRVTVTREELAKLAAAFPVQNKEGK